MGYALSSPSLGLSPSPSLSTPQYTHVFLFSKNNTNSIIHIIVNETFHPLRFGIIKLGHPTTFIRRSHLNSSPFARLSTVQFSHATPSNIRISGTPSPEQQQSFHRFIIAIYYYFFVRGILLYITQMNRWVFGGCTRVPEWWVRARGSGLDATRLAG